MANRPDIYQMITDRVITQLESGIIPWRKPWIGGVPINYETRKPYHGINLLLLPTGGEWMTFLQAQKAGGRIKKGEKGSMIVFYKALAVKPEEGNNDDEATEKTIPFIQYSTVFHISQTEGIESKVTEQEARHDENHTLAAAQEIIDAYLTYSAVKLEFIDGSDRAYYSPLNDKITMPLLNQFDTSEDYYSTLFHEIAHSTGHKSRLDRDIMQAVSRRSDKYTKEELIAEIASAALMHYADIELPNTLENSVAYIAGWIARLKDDKKFIATAASAAQKAVDYTLEIASALEAV